MFKPGDIIQCVNWKSALFRVLEVKSGHYLIAWLKPGGEEARPEKWNLKFSDEGSYNKVTQNETRGGGHGNP